MTAKDGKPCIHCDTSAWYSTGRQRCKECHRLAQRKWDNKNRDRLREIKKDFHRRNPEKAYEYTKRWRDNNPEKAREIKKNWRKNNPEKVKKHKHNFYVRNKEKIYEHQKEWNEKNKNKRMKMRQKWARENRGLLNASRNKRRANKRGSGGSFTADEWNELCKKYDNKCLSCGKKKKLTVDHIVPVSKGGSSNISNIQPLCQSCNSKKGVEVVDYR